MSAPELDTERAGRRAARVRDRLYSELTRLRNQIASSPRGCAGDRYIYTVQIGEDEVERLSALLAETSSSPGVDEDELDDLMERCRSDPDGIDATDAVDLCDVIEELRSQLDDHIETEIQVGRRIHVLTGERDEAIAERDAARDSDGFRAGVEAAIRAVEKASEDLAERSREHAARENYREALDHSISAAALALVRGKIRLETRAWSVLPIGPAHPGAADHPELERVRGAESIAEKLQGKHPDDMMTPEERAESQRVLDEMARARRMAYHASSDLFIAGLPDREKPK